MEKEELQNQIAELETRLGKLDDEKEEEPEPEANAEDLEMIQLKEIKKFFPNAYLKNVENADQIKKVVSETRFGREIQKEVFLLCFLLLIAEMLVARSGKMNIPKRQSHTHSKNAL